MYILRICKIRELKWKGDTQNLFLYIRKGSSIFVSSAEFGKEFMIHEFLSFLFSSVVQSCLTLRDPMDCSTPGFPVHHQLPEPTQTHVHHVGDAIQPFHPLSSPSPPVSIFPSIRVFSNESALHIRWPNYWSFSFSISPSNLGLISFRIDWLDLLAVQGTLKRCLQYCYIYI